MSTKATPQVQKSATPILPVATPMALGSARAFTDETIIQEQESSSADWQVAAAAGAPPPEEKGDRTANSTYNFSRISVADYVPATVQTKLVVGAPGDKYEQEADAMADQVMSVTSPVQKQEELEENPESQTQLVDKTLQPQTEEEGTVYLKPLTVQPRKEQEGTIHLKSLAETIQRKEIEGVVHLKPLANQVSPIIQQTLKNYSAIARKGEGEFAASDNIETRIKNSKGSGQPLPDETRTFMEDRFGNDFGGVKVHTGSDSVQLSKELGAQAFTHGEDVYFNSGKYSPHTDEGKKLLAHELTHTIQQTGPKIKAKPIKYSEKTHKIQAKKSSFLAQPISPPVAELTKLKTGSKIQSASDNAKAPEDAVQDKDSEKDQEKKEEPKEQQNQESPQENATASEQGGAVGGAEGGTEGGTEGGAAGGAGGGAGATVESVTVPQETGETAPDSPQEDPAFQAVVKQSENAAGQYTQHPDPKEKAQEAQQAAEDPQKQKRDAEATKVEETGQQKTKPFNRAAFEKAILDKLGLAVPKNLQEADNFSKNNKLNDVKGQLNQQVEQNKQEAAGGLPQANKTAPDPSKEKPKETQPIPDIKQDVGNQQPTVEADKAVPKEKSEQEIEKPLEETAKNLDSAFGEVQAKLVVGAPGDKYEQEADRMAERVMAMPAAETTEEVEQIQSDRTSQPTLQSQTETANLSQEVSPAETVETEQLLTEAVGRSRLLIQRKVALEAPQVEQPSKEVSLNTNRLETWGEMGGTQALTALKGAKKHSQEGAKEYRQQEEGQLTAARGEAVATADKSNQEMFGDRAANMTEVGGEQEQTKTEDEKKREQVTANIEKIYQQTKDAVDARLKKLDSDVDKEFKSSSDTAKSKFEAYVRTKMDAYKKDRYSGWTGGLKWAKDKLFGMPSEVNRFYEDGKKLYIDEMKKSISKIASIVETGLNEAKELVDKGRQQVNEYVTSLPEDLKEVGAESAATIQSKFDSLEQSVRDKQNQLVDSLAQKYQANLQELDKSIDKLKAENKGLVDKALDAIADVAKAIIKAVLTPIKDLLAPFIGEQATKVIDAIIDDPGQFMKNLFKGIGDGLNNFVSNVGKHLLNGLVGWLFGNIGSEIKLPEKFDLRGFLDILLQVLGLTQDYVFSIAEQFLGSNIVGLIRFIIDYIVKNGTDSLKVLWELVKVISETGMDAILMLIEQGAEGLESLPEPVQAVFQSLGVSVETLIGFSKNMLDSLGESAFELVAGLGKGAKLVFDFFSSVMQEGILGIWKFIKSSIDTLKEIFMKDLTEMLIIEVVKQGVIWLISMLNPASGLVKIVKAIVDVVFFIIEKKEQIKAFVDSILNTLKSIIEGTPSEMAGAIENALSKAIPMLLGFLASLLGIGGIPGKIQKLFNKIRAPITKVVTTIFEKGKSFFKGVGKATKKGFNKAKTAVKSAFKGEKKAKNTTPKVKQNDRSAKKNKPVEKSKQGGATKTDKPVDKTKENKDRKKDGKADEKKKDKSQKKFGLEDFLPPSDGEDSADESTQDEEETTSTDSSETDDAEEESTIQRSQQKNQNSMADPSGFNFSNVRIHADAGSDRLSRSSKVGNLTTESGIFFHQDADTSKTPTPQKFLTHVVQQSGNSPQVASSNPLLSRTVQRVSEDAPYFVRRQAEGNSNTVEISVKGDRQKS